MTRPEDRTPAGRTPARAGARTMLIAGALAGMTFSAPAANAQTLSPQIHAQVAGEMAAAAGALITAAPPVWRQIFWACPP